jgi:hypothetical protein
MCPSRGNTRGGEPPELRKYIEVPILARKEMIRCVRPCERSECHRIWAWYPRDCSEGSAIGGLVCKQQGAGIAKVVNGAMHSVLERQRLEAVVGLIAIGQIRNTATSVSESNAGRSEQWYGVKRPHENSHTPQVVCRRPCEDENRVPEVHVMPKEVPASGADVSVMFEPTKRTRLDSHGDPCQCCLSYQKQSDEVS